MRALTCINIALLNQKLNRTKKFQQQRSMNFRSPIERHVRAFNTRLTECETVTQQYKNKWKERDRPSEAFRRKDRKRTNFIIFLFLKIRRRKKPTHTHNLFDSQFGHGEICTPFYRSIWWCFVVFCSHKSNNISPLNKSARFLIWMYGDFGFFFSLTQFVWINYVQHIVVCILLKLDLP